MAAQDHPKPAPDSRTFSGPRPLGALLPRLVKPAFRHTSPAVAQVLADWEAIVGPVLASVSAPKRLTSGTLTIACSGPVAMELQHYATELIERINTHLGSATVKTLRFMQTALPAPRPPPVRPPVPQAVIEAAETAVAGLPEGELRTALAALGRAVLVARPPRGKSSTA